MEALTERQATALKIIAMRQVTRRIGPTLREVAKLMGLAPNAVQRYVEALRLSGAVEPDAGYGLVMQEPKNGLIEVRHVGTGRMHFPRKMLPRAPMPKPGGKLL